MANPFGYGDVLPLGSAVMGSASLVPKQWSPQVLRYGRDLVVFANFLETKTELGKGKGDTIYVGIYGEDGALGTTALTEGTSITVGTQTVDSFSVTIAEYGRAIAKPRTLDYFSNIDNQNQMIQTLAWNYAKSWDALAKAAFLTNEHVVFSVGSMGSYSFGSGNYKGVGSLTDEMLEYTYDLFRVNKVPPFPDGYYRWICNPKQARQIMRLDKFEKLNVYNPIYGPSGIKAQVLGEYQGFQFITTQENMSATQPIGHAFGRNVGVQAFGLPMDIRYEPDWKQDFQRLQAFAWYVIGGVAKALSEKGTHCIEVRSGTT